MKMLDETEDSNDLMILNKLLDKARRGNQIYLIDFDGFSNMELVDLYKSKFEVSPNYHQNLNYEMNY